MAKYLCWKDKYDLTKLVESELTNHDHNDLGFRPVLLGEAQAIREPMQQDFNAPALAEFFKGHDRYLTIVVTCPGDNVDNSFTVERPD